MALRVSGGDGGPERGVADAEASQPGELAGGRKVVMCDHNREVT